MGLGWISFRAAKHRVFTHSACSAADGYFSSPSARTSTVVTHQAPRKSLVVTQRIRLSIGGADSRHFHPITAQPPPPNSNRSSRSSTPQAAATPGDPQSGISTPGVAVGGCLEEESDTGAAASLTKRVLRVHTGGPFASSGVSLPVPRGSGAGGGWKGGGAAVERGSGSERRFGWGLDIGAGKADEEHEGHGGRGEFGGRYVRSRPGVC